MESVNETSTAFGVRCTKRGDEPTNSQTVTSYFGHGCEDFAALYSVLGVLRSFEAMPIECPVTAAAAVHAAGRECLGLVLRCIAVVHRRCPKGSSGSGPADYPGNPKG
jgi:hypothetical protein